MFFKMGDLSFKKNYNISTKISISLNLFDKLLLSLNNNISLGVGFLGLITFPFLVMFAFNTDFKSVLYHVYGTKMTTGYIDNISLLDNSFFNDFPRQKLHYYYQAGEDVFEGESHVSPDRQYYKGKTVIEYVDTMEFISRVEGTNNNIYPLSTLFYLSVFPFFTFLNIYNNRFRVKRINNALKAGGFAKADLQGKKIVDDTHKKEVYALAYYYEVNGFKNTLFFQTEDPELFSQNETLIYPLDDPGNTVMLNELPDQIINKIIKEIKKNNDTLN